MARRALGDDGVRSFAAKAFAFTKAHLAAVGAVLAAACLWGVYSASSVQSEVAVASPPEPTGVVEVTASPAAGEEPAADPVGEAAGPGLLVHVLGAVNQPGLVSLADGARVNDAINAAGGLAPDADPAELNLAQPLSDGMQVIIGTQAEPRGEVRAGDGAAVSPGAAGSAGGKISLNRATQAELESLPGVGPVMAGRIIAWREQSGPFVAVEQLQEVSGIGAKVYAQLAPLVEL